MIDIGSRLALETLFARYVHALDDDRLEEWPELFTEDGCYHLTTAENHALGRPIGLIRAENRAMLRDRVMSLREANIFEAQCYRHSISATLVDRFHRDEAEVRSCFTVIRTMQDGSSTVFAAGRYLDRVVFTKAGPLFAQRIVVCDSRRFDTLLAIPL